MAERKVKNICRRKLESASYSDVGYTLPVDNPNDTRSYVWYLREPTGTAIAFASLTPFTLNDDTVLEADVVIEADRLIFASGGKVEVTYPGGYCRDTTHKSVILTATIHAMHIIHRAIQEASTPDFAPVVDALALYTAVLGGEPYAAAPE